MLQRLIVTITRITTHGKFKDFTISIATDVFPEPELPAMPIMLKSAHGGEYLSCVAFEYTGEMDSMVSPLLPKSKDLRTAIYSK